MWYILLFNPTYQCLQTISLTLLRLCFMLILLPASSLRRHFYFESFKFLLDHQIYERGLPITITDIPKIKLKGKMFSSNNEDRGWILNPFQNHKMG